MIIDQPEKQDPVTDAAPQAAENLSYVPRMDEEEEEVPAYPYPREPNGDHAQENGDANPDQKRQAEPQPYAYARPPPLPARTPRTPQSTSSDDSYARDPHKLVAYLIPFPKPRLHTAHARPHSASSASEAEVPDRFLVYTPPPPPLTKPAEGEKEGKRHMVQRKWQREVREAKTSTAKGASWKGVKSKATRGIDWAIGRTTTSGLDFLNRMSGDDAPPKKDKDKGKDKDKDKDKDKHAKEEDEARARAQGEEVQGPDAVADGEANLKPEGEEVVVGLTELVLVYPTTFRDSPEGMRKEFVDSMMRTKSKAEKNTILATGLLPVAFAVDVLAMVIWPFGGLAEIDSVWAYASFRGAKVARSTTKRLEASEGAEAPADESASQTTADGAGAGEKGKKSKKSKKQKHLKLTFTPSMRVQTLARYLAARCHDRDPRMFPPAGGSPTETEVLEAIGWAPSQTLGGERKNYHDLQWEISELKDDFRQVMQKGAREWDKWCKAFEKNPKKALKK